MKILILMNGGFDTYGPSRHLYDALIEDLLKSNISIHLIESHSTGIDPDIPNKFLNNKLFSYQTINKKNVCKRKFVQRYLIDFKYVFSCKKKIKKIKDKFDLVFVQSLVCAPFMIPMVKKILKIPVVWNIQDMFPGSSIANGVLKSKLLQKVFFKLHKRAYKYSDFITVISEDMKNKVIEQGVSDEKITVIPDWFDDSSVKEISWEENKLVKKYKLSKDNFYVQFAGTIGFNFDYRLFLKVANELKNKNNIIFHVIGFGSQYDIFKQAAEKMNLKNIIFLPLEKQEYVSDVYSACNLAFIPLPFGVIGNSVPSKIALLMACKRPFITSADEESLYIKMINENKIGLGFGCNEFKEIAEKIRYLSEHKDECVKMGQNGYGFGKLYYSRRYNTNKYIDFFKEIVNK